MSIEIPAADLNEKDLGELRKAVATALGEEVLVCGRVWEAWSYGTMSEDDFSVASEDQDMLDNVIDALYPLAQAQIAAAGVMVIKDDRELENLPVRSVVIDADDAVCRIERKEADRYREIDGENLWSYGVGPLWRNHTMSMPVTVIYLGAQL